MPSATETPHGAPSAGDGMADDTIDMVRQLWPSPHVVTAAGPSLRSRGYALLPNARRPTRLVPDPATRATARALVGTVHGRGAVAAARQAAMYAGARAGLLRLAPHRLRVQEVPGAPSLLSHLGEVLGEPVTASIHLGPPRANRKPVLHVVGRGGQSLAFVKIGVNPLTRTLVGGEAGALTALGAAGLTELTVPRVVHAGAWRELEVLCIAPVSTANAGPVPPARLRAAMTEVATALGTASTTLADSPHLQALRASAASSGSPHGPALVAAVGRLLDRHGEVVIPTGVWHGDWTPWNMGFDGSTLSVWDWERLESGVPLGLDALHFAIQRAMRVPGAEPAAVAREQVSARHALLQPWGLDRLQADVVTAVYLLTIGTRYAVDGQESAGARLGRLGGWLLPVLDALVTPTRTGRST